MSQQSIYLKIHCTRKQFVNFFKYILYSPIFFFLAETHSIDYKTQNFAMMNAMFVCFSRATSSGLSSDLRTWL